MLNKKMSFQDLSKNLSGLNNNQKSLLSSQVCFNPKDKIKMNLNSSKEEKANNAYVNVNNNNNLNNNNLYGLINNNNNYDNNSESENYSPIGKLVSFQNIGSNARTSNAELDDENNLLNHNHNKVKEQGGDKNILNLKNNFDPGTASENPNESSNEKNIEEEMDEYQEESNEDDCI